MEQQASIEDYGYKQELRRSLGLRDLVIFGIVFMAPVSSMTTFGLMAASSKGHNLLSYVIGFVAMLFTAYSYGKMVEAFPIAGSAYSYAQRAVSPKLGFIAGWVMLMDYFLIPMLLYVVSSVFAHELVPQIPFWAWILIYVVPVTFINIRGVEVAAKVNFIMTGLMIAAIVAFVIAAVKYAISGDGVSLFSMKGVYDPKTFSLGAVVSGSVLAVLSYLGFDGITTLSEEVHESTHKISLAIFIALFLQSALYFSVAYFGAIVAPDFTAFKNADTAFFEMAFKVGGSALQTFITLVIIVSGASTALAGQSAASRLLYGMGRDKVIPAALFAYLHPKYKTPTYNILFMGAIGVIGALTISLANLCDMVAFGGLFGFICVNLSVIAHYYVRGRSGKFVRHVIFPLLGMCICGYILVGMSPLAKIVGFTWMGLGIVYLVVRSLASRDFKDILAMNSLVNPNAVCEMENE
jgi:amino acid transporter